jgi:5'-nucleotidase
MQDWWQEHLDLTVRARIHKEKIHSITQLNIGFLREGTGIFFFMLKEKNIPIIILSAGIGDFIEGILKKEEFLSPNVHLISNYFSYDNAGYINGYTHDIMHTHNKNDHRMRGKLNIEKIEEKKNILLLGDSLGDLNMAEGISYDHILKIGFLNDKTNQEEAFKEGYDVVIYDETFHFINELLAELCDDL